MPGGRVGEGGGLGLLPSEPCPDPPRGLLGGAAVPQRRLEPSPSVGGRAGGRARAEGPRRLPGCLGAQLPRRQPPAARGHMGTRGAGCPRCPGRGAPRSSAAPLPHAGRCCAGGGRGGAAPLAGWAAPRRGGGQGAAGGTEAGGGRGETSPGPCPGAGGGGKFGFGSARSAAGYGLSRCAPLRAGTHPGCLRLWTSLCSETGPAGLDFLFFIVS